VHPLDRLGYTDADAASLTALGDPALVPARVLLDHGRYLRLHTGTEELLAVGAGKLKHGAASAGDLPAVGDFVAIHRRRDLAVIEAVLPRRSKLARAGAGERADEQVLAANVDLVILVLGLDADFNVRRIERYLSLVRGSGARALLVLNKADLCPDLPGRVAAVAETAEAAGTTDVLVTSLTLADGHAAVAERLEPRRTHAMLGSSGVGKSTLLNRLLGSEVQRTAVVRKWDKKGRHTTTAAQLFALAGGALMIDTPGLRELALWETASDLAAAFADITACAAACRFSDCRHDTEPGCAVRPALEAGALDPARYASWEKLRDEQEELATRRARRGR
jgi:ribosome biogenesis GTPase